MNEWLLIAAMTVLTFTPRYLPFGLAGKVKIPPILERSLTYVPIAVLTSIITQSSIIREGELAINLTNHHLLAVLAAFVSALISRRLFVIVTVGLTIFVVAKLLL
ncbi:MAG: AzlD domain-containing protein [SAR324 cluster bacterium]|jgi:branched-subunit amino acid transport protein|tara:strand:+ start:954 stop:1268 length:315 start_codon:yes stop_codon:yes gene_type:complete